MMIPRQTLGALQQIFYDALTIPPIAYEVDGVAATVPIGQVVPQSVWEAGNQAITPLVALAISRMADPSRYLTMESDFTLKLWVVSKTGSDEPSAIYEAIRARLQYADQDATGFASDLSRAGVGATTDLGAQIRECKETRVTDPAYERETNRWYLVAEYHVAAV